MYYKKNDWGFALRLTAKILSIVLTVALVCQIFPVGFAVGVLDSSPTDSAGETPRQTAVRLGRESLLAALDGAAPQGYLEVTVSTARELADLSARVASGEFQPPAGGEPQVLDSSPAGAGLQNVYVRLAGDIDLGEADENGLVPALLWEPIGTALYPFQGIFNGQGHTIRGLDPDLGEGGTLFGSLQGATVQNLNLAPAETLVELFREPEGYLYAEAEGESILNVSLIKTDSGLLTDMLAQGGRPDLGWFYEANAQQRAGLQETADQAYLDSPDGSFPSLLAIAGGAVLPEEDGEASGDEGEAPDPGTFALAAASDGDVSWGDSPVSAGLYVLDTPEQVAGISLLVQKGYSFKKQVIVLREDMDFDGVVIYPIGSVRTADMGTAGKLYPYLEGRILGWKDFDPGTDGKPAYNSLLAYDDLSVDPVTLSNITYSTRNSDAVAFVANGQRAIVENLIFENCTARGVQYVAAVIAMSGGCIVNRCGVVGGTVDGLSEVGGLVAYNRTPYNNDLGASTEGGGWGILGDMKKLGVDPVSYWTVHNTGENWLNRACVFNSYCTATVTGTQNVGGIIGFTEQSANITGGVIGCFFSGTLVGEVNVGGILGKQGMSYNPIHISHSATSGVISGSSAVGGIVGAFFDCTSNPRIDTCYSAATINGAQHVGGVLGQRIGVNSLTLRDNYFCGKIISPQLASMDSLGASTIGPVLGSGALNRVSNNYFCRGVLATIKPELLDDDSVHDRDTQLTDFLATSPTVAAPGGGSFPSTWFTNSNHTGLSSVNGGLCWTEGDLMLDGAPHWYDHGQDITGNHPQLLLFEEMHGDMPFQSFSSLSTLASMDVPNALYSYYDRAEGVVAFTEADVRSGAVGGYDLLNPPSGTSRFVYKIPAGLSGWTMVDTASGTVLLPNTAEPRPSNEITGPAGQMNGNTVANAIHIPDPTVPGGTRVIHVYQDLDAKELTLTTDYGENADRPITVLSNASEVGKLSIAYNSVSKDSALRIQEDPDHMPAALVPRARGRANSPAVQLSPYETVFSFLFPESIQDASNCKVEVYSWENTQTMADRVLAASSDPASTSPAKLNLSVAAGQDLRVASDRRFIQNNRVYQFVLTVLDAAGNLFRTSDGTDYYLGWAVEDRNPAITFRYDSAADQAFYAGRLLTGEGETISLGAGEQPLLLGGGSFPRTGIPYQRLQVERRDSSYGTFYQHGILLEDDDAISLKTATVSGSAGEELISLEVKSCESGVDPADINIRNFQNYCGLYRVAYRAEDGTGNLSESILIRDYQVVEKPSVRVSGDPQVPITLGPDGRPVNGVAKDLNQLGFNMTNDEMIYCGRLIYQNLQNAGGSETPILEAARDALHELMLQHFGQYYIWYSDETGAVRRLYPLVDPLTEDQVRQLLDESGYLPHSFTLYTDPAFTRPLAGYEGVPLVINYGRATALTSMLRIREADGVTPEGVLAGVREDRAVYTIPREEFLSQYGGDTIRFRSAVIGTPYLTYQSGGKSHALLEREGLLGGWAPGQTLDPDSHEAQTLTYQVSGVFGLPIPTAKDYLVIIGNDNVDIPAPPQGGGGDAGGDENFWLGVSKDIQEAPEGGRVSARVRYQDRYAPVYVLEDLAVSGGVTLELALDHDVTLTMEADQVDLSKTPEERYSYNIYLAPSVNLWVQRDALGYGVHFQQFYTASASDPDGVEDRYWGGLTAAMPLDEELRDAESLQLYRYDRGSRTYTLLETLGKDSVLRTAGEEDRVVIPLKEALHGEYVLTAGLFDPVLNPDTGGYPGLPPSQGDAGVPLSAAPADGPPDQRPAGANRPWPYAAAVPVLGALALLGAALIKKRKRR